jgi:translation initiation factor 2A
LVEKEGPIHDVAWSPNSKEFGVVYGFMPAKTTIFNSKAQATHSFALGPRNTINFSPFGRFVLVAGFGNLAGQVDVYDITKDFAKVCTIEASNASVCEWSPDASHILFATTSPRLRVDNGIRIFHVGGGLMYNADMNELYDVFWRPRGANAAPPAQDPLKVVPEPHASAKAVLANAKPPSKPAGAYRPPGARGTTTPLHFKREDEGGAAVMPTNGTGIAPGANGFGRGARRREVPGAEPVEQLPPGAAPGGGVSLTAEGDEGLSKAALKNKKKREARRAKEAAAERERAEGGGDPAADGGSTPLAPLGPEGAPTGPRAMSASPDRRGAFNHRRNRSGYENHHARSPQRGFGQGRGGHQPGQASPHHQQYQQQQHYQNQYHQQPYPHHQQQAQQYHPQQAQYQAQLQGQYDLAAAAAQVYLGAPEAAASAPDVTVTSPGGNAPRGAAGGGAAAVAGGGGGGGGGAAAAGASGAAAQSDKKLRGLLKKLRAIEDLKMRQAAGERLEATQVQKIGTEDGVRRELEALGVAD